MKHLLFSACLAGALACGPVAFAQDAFDPNAPPVGKEANTFMVRLRAIGVIPLIHQFDFGDRRACACDRAGCARTRLFLFLHRQRCA